MAMDGDGGLLQAARQIGHRLVAQAEWSGDACSWTVRRPARGDDRYEVELVPGGPMVYQGASGIALFLAELYRRTGDADVRRTMEGALRTVAAAIDDVPVTAFGFHGGRVGAAYAAYRAGRATGDAQWTALAETILRPMAGREAEDRGLDVIGGGAGAIPALLEMAGTLPPELSTRMAVALGDQLLRVARREPGGWCWGEMPSSVRCLLGYAHGASGFAHGLLELWNATGDGRYLFGAEQALAYERQFLDDERGNWPDFRWAELSLYYSDGRMDELATLLREGGQVTPYERRYMSAWCHGAPGIGLARLRAYALTGREVYRDEARTAVGNVRETMGGMMNWSLCHGTSGNLDTLIVGADVLGVAEARQEAEAMLRKGVEENEGEDRFWASGTMGGGPEPSLMMGEAGVGYMLLRAAFQDTPSVLLVQPMGPNGREPGADRGYAAVAAQEAAFWFPRGIGAAAALLHAAPPPATEAAERNESYASHVHAWLTEQAAADATGRLADALEVDRLRWELASSITDLSEPILDRMRAPDREADVDWSETEAVLSSKVRIAQQRHDWDAWLAAGAAGEPEEKSTFTLVYRVGNDVKWLRITPLAALVLQSTAVPGTLERVVERVEEALDAAGHREVLRQKVAEQLRNAYGVGAVEPVRVVAAA